MIRGLRGSLGLAINGGHLESDSSRELAIIEMPKQKRSVPPAQIAAAAALIVRGHSYHAVAKELSRRLETVKGWEAEYPEVFAQAAKDLVSPEDAFRDLLPKAV